MTEFFHNRFGKGEVEAFSDPKEYNKNYVERANKLPSFTLIGYTPNPTACPTSDLTTDTCLKEYAYNAAKYEKLTVKNDTVNGSFGDGKDKHSEIIISNINLGIGIVLMMSYVYSFSEK